MLTLLADATAATGVSVGDLAPLISTLGSGGFAIWFAYHTTTVTIPNQQKEHREAIEKMNSVHAETIRGLVDEMKSQRNDYGRWKESYFQRPAGGMGTV